MKILSWVLPVLLVVAVGQLAIPAYMIHRQEATLRDGRAYKFKTAPVDPYDAFRGRYVRLRFEQDHAPWGGALLVQHGLLAYARIEEDSNGFAVVRELSLQPPSTGEFFKVQMAYGGWGTNSSMAYFTMPFDRYYMEEKKAPKAERAYQERNRRGQTNLNTYAVVRIRSGHSVLENVYIDGKPIREIVTANHQPVSGR